jgi:GNAT superfamily N-acetyltransferase
VAYRPPEPLERRHNLDDFDCGEPALDEWLERHARGAHAAGSARVFVTTVEDDDTVVGYYAVAAAQVAPEAATERTLKGQPRTRPVPAILLARLAVDRRHQRAGLGRSLLQDVMLRSLEAAEAIGARVLLVHAKHEAAKAWYLQYGFEESPTDPLHLVMLLKDVRALLQGRGADQPSKMSRPWRPGYPVQSWGDLVGTPP